MKFGRILIPQRVPLFRTATTWVPQVLEARWDSIWNDYFIKKHFVYCYVVTGPRVGWATVFYSWNPSLSSAWMGSVWNGERPMGSRESWASGGNIFWTSRYWVCSIAKSFLLILRWVSFKSVLIEINDKSSNLHNRELSPSAIKC